jgi:hypothetical protein
MKILAIILAAILFIAAASNYFSIYWTFHPRRAALLAALGVGALVWSASERVYSYAGRFIGGPPMGGPPNGGRA